MRHLGRQIVDLPGEMAPAAANLRHLGRQIVDLPGEMAPARVRALWLFMIDNTGGGSSDGMAWGLFPVVFAAAGLGGKRLIAGGMFVQAVGIGVG